mmetsp:Transcript_10425/g.15704  ORF Transcript_10425/g.15704 Transcript_10425/m.15704 type:complete len:219 (-) Transcript_10425:208-864(-)
MKVEEDLTFLTMLGSKNDNGNSSSNNIASVNNGNGALKTCQESNGTSTNVPITNEEKKAVKKEKVYLTKIFAAFTLFFYIVTRISLQSFCDFDETIDSYIVPYTPSEPTIVIAEIDAITADSPTRESTVLQTHTNMSHVQGTSSQPSSSSSLSSSSSSSLLSSNFAFGLTLGFNQEAFSSVKPALPFLTFSSPLLSSSSSSSSLSLLSFPELDVEACT